MKRRAAVALRTLRLGGEAETTGPLMERSYRDDFTFVQDQLTQSLKPYTIPPGGCRAPHPCGEHNIFIAMIERDEGVDGQTRRASERRRCRTVATFIMFTKFDRL